MPFRGQGHHSETGSDATSALAEAALYSARHLPTCGRARGRCRSGPQVTATSPEAGKRPVDRRRSGQDNQQGGPAQIGGDVAGSGLKRGDRGAAVQELQEALRGAGAVELRVDADFGARTEAALRQLQHRVGLEPTGVLDGRTAQILRRRTPGERPPLLYRNPADPFHRHLLPDDGPPVGQRGG
jgi:hypothetical protein